MIGLVSLIPHPIPIENGSIRGELRVNGNIEQNIVQFRFRFANTVETAPVCLTVSAAGKTYRYYCTIPETEPPEMVTPLFSPEFSVGQCFCVTEIEPLVCFCKNKPDCKFDN